MCKWYKKDVKFLTSYYKVIFELIPIGSPIKYHPTIIISHTTDKISITDITFFITPNILKLESFSYLYINPIATIRYTYIGENNFPTESAAINKVWVNDGEIFALINKGTYIGATKFHLATEFGINIDIIIIVIKASNTSNTPDIVVEPTKSIIFVEITVEKFVQSITS